MLIHLNPEQELHVDFTYQLLKERYKYAETINIMGMSLPTLPTYKQHRNWLIENVKGDHYLYLDPHPIAMVSVRTDDSGEWKIENEVGIFVLESEWGKGYGGRALEAMFRLYPRHSFNAKINPDNEQSKKMFAKIGFKHVAEIWRKDE
jgi:RimJ/RimL family protein N-acetyltransferase